MWSAIIASSRVRGIGFDVDYQAVLNRAASLGYTLPSIDQQFLQNQLIVDLKSSGIWNKLDIFYVFANNGSQEFATLNWKNPLLYQCSLINSPSFTTNVGFQGNGINSYINTNYNPSVHAVNFTLDSHSYGGFNSNPTAQGQFFGAFGNTYCEIVTDNALSRLIVHDVNIIGRTVNVGVDSQNGWLINQRNVSNNFLTYRNNINLPHIGSASSSLPNITFNVFRRTSNIPSAFGNGIASILYTGGWYDSTERTNFYNNINTYLTSL
jgi:hypothetical protein